MQVLSDGKENARSYDFRHSRMKRTFMWRIKVGYRASIWPSSKYNFFIPLKANCQRRSVKNWQSNIILPSSECWSGRATKMMFNSSPTHRFDINCFLNVLFHHTETSTCRLILDSSKHISYHSLNKVFIFNISCRAGAKLMRHMRS